MGIHTYKIDTAMGKIMNFDSNPTPFLSPSEIADFDEIGYTGKLKGVKMSRETYLNSLNKGTFQIEQTRYDNGDYREQFLIIQAI